MQSGALSAPKRARDHSSLHQLLDLNGSGLRGRCGSWVSSVPWPSSSASPDGGSTGPIRWCTAFFEARGRVDHLEFFLGRGVLGLVAHQADCRAARALPGLVHEQLQFLLPAFVIRTLRNKLFAGIVLIFSGIGEEPSHEWILKLRRARGQERGED